MDNFPNTPTDPEFSSEPDWAHLLPRDAFHEIILVLRGALPPPGLDDPDAMAWQDWARRDRAAMAAVAALLPENAAEGRLAARFVAADAWSLDCLRLARERRREPDIAQKCRAQALSLMRESNSALRLLLRLQAVRQAMAKQPEAAGRAAWVEHAAVGRMGEALGLDLAEPVEPVEPVASVAPVAQAGGGSMATSPGDVGKFRLVADNGLNSLLAERETAPRLGPGGLANGKLGLEGSGQRPCGWKAQPHAAELLGVDVVIHGAVMAGNVDVAEQGL